MGKYSPGIATDQHYYFTLNGILVAFRGRYSPAEQSSRQRRVPALPGGRPPQRAR